MNLKYTPELVKNIQKITNLEIEEINRENQPKKVKFKEFSTMQWLIKESVNKNGRIPDIIWDKGALGKEPMIRLFANNASDMIKKLEKIINIIIDD